MKHHKVIAWAAIMSIPAVGAYATQPTASSSPQSATAPALSKASAPVPIHQVPPQYPAMAQFEAVQGDIQVCFTVEADGKLANLHIGKTNFWRNTPPVIHAGYNQEALIRASKESLKAEAVYTLTQWKYKPGYKNGNPVSTSDTCQMIDFKLSG